MGPSWEWSRWGLFVFLLCPAAGYYGRITFSFDRALFILDLFTWLDVVASVFGLGKRECGALTCGLRPAGEQTNIARYVPISAERRSMLGYQLNDRELVE